ncbi:Cysteine proteinase RD21a [Spatholobus suberectus]|nr:Cysteine proteinase RD21a [Spatholobus suberectus]
MTNIVLSFTLDITYEEHADNWVKLHQFIIENGGIDTDKDYPYRSVDGICDLTKKNAIVQIDGYKDVPPYDENASKKDVAHQPISVATEGSGKPLQLYQLDYGVVVIGYGSENEMDYWWVRNSWGTGLGKDD